MVAEVTGHMDLNEVRDQARKLAEARREARRDYERYVEQEAHAQFEYRKVKAREFLSARGEGQPASAAEIVANSAAADAELTRNIAHGLAKSAEHRMAELEADRAMLRQLADWSQRLEGLPQPQWSKAA